jgi:hypothetical protein
MSYIDVTFERGGQVVKTLAKVYGGWDSSKKSGYQFYDHQFVDFRGDVTLHVRVWMFSTWTIDLRESRHDIPEHVTEFPLDLTSQLENGRIRVSIAKGRVSIAVWLDRDLPWITTSNGKPAIDWGPELIAQHANAAYMLRHMIVFNLPSAKRGDYKEWDLLPFLPGGLIERNRRKH